MRLEFKEALTQAVQEVFKLYQLKAEPRGEAVKSTLCSTEPINVLTGFSMNLRGNIVFGFSLTAALKIASMIGGKESTELDAKARSGLGDLVRFTVDLAISRSQLARGISLAPPIIITGENIFLMIGQVRTVQLTFGLDDDLISVSYNLEQSGKSASAYHVS